MKINKCMMKLNFPRRSKPNMIMHYSRIICISFLLLIFNSCIYYQTSSRNKLIDQNVHIVKRQFDFGVRFYAKLINCTEATITLNATYQNMKPSVPFPVTVDSKGQKFFEIARLIATGDKWNYSYQYSWILGRRTTSDSSSFIYSLPYKSGPFKVAQGYKGSSSHLEGSDDEYAIDWKMPIGTEIYSAREGIVVAIRMDSDTGGIDSVFKKSGNYVVIMHNDGTFAEYFHLLKNSIIVKLGQAVQTNELLALSGNTGHSSGPHLHFAVFRSIDGYHRKTIPVKFNTKYGEIKEIMEGDFN